MIDLGPHIDGYHQPNWSLEADMDCLELGQRVMRALDVETLGWSALWDQIFEKEME